jgi:C_GCAxxG_C_C family probable redox protein
MEDSCRFQPEGLTTEQMRMFQRVQQGFHCSEILLFAGLEAQGKTNPDLIRAVSGLAGGIGFSGEVCGALTGGACLIGLYDGRGDENDKTDERFTIMVGELVDWFSEKYGERYGGIRCTEITEDDPANHPVRCPRIVGAVLKKVKSLLNENGIEWEQSAFHQNAKSDPTQSRPIVPDNLSRSACPCASGTGPSG